MLKRWVLSYGRGAIVLQPPELVMMMREEIEGMKTSYVLRSRIVTIKKFQEPEPFLEAVQRQLDAMEISGMVKIPLNRKGEIDRKTLVRYG